MWYGWVLFGKARFVYTKYILHIHEGDSSPLKKPLVSYSKMEKKVIICDNCETKIAKHKCAICNKDVCVSCCKNYGNFIQQTWGLFICQSCSANFLEKDFWTNEFKEKLKELVGEYGRKAILIYSLGERDKDKIYDTLTLRAGIDFV